MAAGLGFIVGILGNIISILVFTSPIKTFWGVVKKKSTENYQGIPYVTTLLSTSLWTYYGLLNPKGLLIMTVNGAGALLQLIYVSLFLIYAPRDKKVEMGKLIASLNIGFLGSVIALTQFAVRKEIKLSFVGIICAALSIGMYASPLSAMGMVIKTKSVKYMPFLLSFFLLLNGGIWSLYALLVKDFFVGVPNAVGFISGSAQIIIYSIYKKKSKKFTETKDEGEGSSITLVKRTVEIQANHDGDELAHLKSRSSLRKGRSLPLPIVNKLYTVPTKTTKAVSLSPHELDSVWDISKDLENGEKNHP